MNENEQALKKLMQDRLARYEADPGPDLWPAIETGLNPNRRAGWWRWPVAAVLLVLLGLSWWLRPVALERQPALAWKPLAESAGNTPVDTVPKRQPPALEAPLAPRQLKNSRRWETRNLVTQEAGKSLADQSLAALHTQTTDDQNRIEPAVEQVARSNRTNVIQPVALERPILTTPSKPTDNLPDPVEISGLVALEQSAFAEQQDQGFSLSEAVNRVSSKLGANFVSPVEVTNYTEDQTEVKTFTVKLGKFRLARKTFTPIQ